MTGGDYLRPGPAISSQDVIVLIIIFILALKLFVSGRVKTTVIPEQVAVKLVQKAKVAEKKRKEAEFAEAVRAELARESKFFAERMEKSS